jgi:hypothetical protein
VTSTAAAVDWSGSGCWADDVETMNARKTSSGKRVLDVRSFIVSPKVIRQFHVKLLGWVEAIIGTRQMALPKKFYSCKEQ